MKKTYFKFCILQASYWSFFAAIPAYITAYMLSKGIGGATLGILIASQMGSAFAGSIIWSRFVDRKQASREFFLIGITAAALLSVLLFCFADKPVFLFVLYPLFGFMNGPIATTLDSWVIASTHQVEAGAKSRTFGTLGYAVTMLVSGLIIGRFGYRFMPYIGIGFIAIAFLVALSQPKAEGLRFAASSGKGSLGALRQTPKYLLLVAVVFFTGMATGPINNMKVLVFESVGGNASFLGWDAFIGCLIQSPFLIFSAKMKHIRGEYRLIASAVCAFTYALIVYIARNPAMVVIGTVFMNVSFGILFPTMREITEASVSSDMRTTAHAVVDIAYGSVANMIASAWSGSVIENAGRVTMCSICMVLEIIALVFCIRIVLLGRTQICRHMAQKTCA